MPEIRPRRNQANQERSPESDILWQAYVVSHGTPVLILEASRCQNDTKVLAKAAPPHHDTRETGKKNIPSSFVMFARAGIACIISGLFSSHWFVSLIALCSHFVLLRKVVAVLIEGKVPQELSNHVKRERPLSFLSLYSAR